MNCNAGTIVDAIVGVLGVVTFIGVMISMHREQQREQRAWKAFLEEPFLEVLPESEGNDYE